MSNKNRGTGAGGAATNAEGLAFENATDCKFLLDELEGCWERKGKGKFTNYMLPYEVPKYKDNKNLRFHGTRDPGEALIDITNRKIAIIEKKTQKRSGSVIEKLQTASVKRRHYEERYPGFKVMYIFLLVPYFFTKAPSEIEMLQGEEQVSVISVDKDWKKNLLEIF